MDPLHSYFEEHLLEVYKGEVKLLSSGMEAKTAAIAGAASLI
ncbi:hypothetical protein [Arcticibacterium luteifluviistationis]|nr:hypothetical protein [Arcticibacterium luteifluviistationis]